MNTAGALGFLALTTLLFGAGVLFLGKRLRRVGYVVVGVAIASAGIAGATLAFFLYRVERMHERDVRLHVGASKADVLAAQGRPTESTDCFTTYYGRTPKPAPGCAEIVWYYSSVTPEVWEYVFDASGRLIHKHHWQSP